VACKSNRVIGGAHVEKPCVFGTLRGVFKSKQFCRAHPSHDPFGFGPSVFGFWNRERTKKVHTQKLLTAYFWSKYRRILKKLCNQSGLHNYTLRPLLGLLCPVLACFVAVCPICSGHPLGLHGLTNGAIMPQYLTQPQAAQFLGVSTRTLTRWLSQPNPPPCVRLGGRRRYDRDALAAWAAQQSQQVSA